MNKQIIAANLRVGGSALGVVAQITSLGNVGLVFMPMVVLPSKSEQSKIKGSGESVNVSAAQTSIEVGKPVQDKSGRWYVFMDVNGKIESVYRFIN